MRKKNRLRLYMQTSDAERWPYPLYTKVVDEDQYIGPMKRWRCCRYQNNTYLLRFLESNVGEKWNIVYSKLCRSSRKKNNWILRKMVIYFVEEKVFGIKGRLFHVVNGILLLV